MITLSYDHDPKVWLPVPTSFPDGDDRTEQQWVARQALQRRDEGYVETATSGSLDDYFVQVAELARGLGVEHDDVWALLPDDAPGFLAVVVDVVEAEQSLNDVLSAYSARSDSEYEPAAVTQVDAEGLGEGFLVVRNDIAPDRKVFATVYFVFRVDGWDIVLSTQTYDTGLLDWAMPRIRELIDGITVDSVSLDSEDEPAKVNGQ